MPDSSSRAQFQLTWYVHKPGRLQNEPSADSRQAEMSISTKQRGPEVGVQCIFLVGGCAVAYWVDFGFTRMDNQVSWVIFACKNNRCYLATDSASASQLAYRPYLP